jgi:hypothetical protein
VANAATTRRSAPRSPEARRIDTLLRWSVRGVVAIVWLSSAIFAAYILAYYVGAIYAGTPADWNDSLPRLYIANSLAANVGIGVHFGLGAVLLLLGPVQLLASVRNRWASFHRWTGRIYATAALVTGVGGLFYIAMRGTVGGVPMSLGFALYGALMVAAAVQTVRHAMAGRRVLHRAWAIRLFALAVGSWLYRMEYGTWGVLMGKLGRTPEFTGWFDVIMAFWFYLPNLVVAEVFIRGRQANAPPTAKLAAIAIMTATFVFLLLATSLVTLNGWWPTILWRLGIVAE